MERRSVSDLIRELEPLIRKFEADYALAINHVEEEAGCKVGDNYMSVVMKTTVKGSRGNGTALVKVYSKSFMVKYLPLHRELTTVFSTRDLYRNESHVYEKVLPALIGNFGPICIHADDDKIIMEDLKTAGYIALERRDLLDFDHCVAVVETLARFHASSLALKLKDTPGFLEIMKPLKEVVFRRQTAPALGHTIENSITRAIMHLEWIQPRSEDLETGIQYLKRYEDRVYPEMQDLVDPGKGKYDVVSHGDCWKNNIMFRYNTEGEIVGVKLLDFQMTRHLSPAIDFHYFIYSSPKCSVIEENYEDLVAAYHSKFVDTLKGKSGVSDDSMRQLTIEWFRNELKAYAKYGIFTGCWIASAILAEDEDMIDLDTLTLEDIEARKTTEVKIMPKVADRLKTVVIDYVRRYIRE